MTQTRLLTFFSLAALLGETWYCLSGESLVQRQQLTVEYDFAGKREPTLSWASLVELRDVKPDSASIDVIDASRDHGKLVESLNFGIPQAAHVWIDGVTHSANGVVALGGACQDGADRLAGFLAISTQGVKETLVVRTAPYCPHRMAFASDGTLWTTGTELVGGVEISQHYKVLRHFDKTGRLLGSFVDRSVFSSSSDLQYGFMTATTGHVGWYAGPLYGPGGRYYDISNGGDISQFQGLEVLSNRERVDGCALTDDGRVFASKFDPREHRWTLYRLDKHGRRWIDVPVASIIGAGSQGRLYGAQGRMLVMSNLSKAEYSIFRLVEK